MENIVITIARQYGSGGRTVGKMVAEKLNIPFYDREILRMASDESGINESLFNQVDEKLEKNSLFRISKDLYDGKIIPPDSDDYTSTKNLFNFQAKIIKELAESESCVIVGRAADFVLKDYENVMSVFVHADEKFCLERAMERNSMTEEEMLRYMLKRDKFRGDYYKHYTGQEWWDARNYDLCLNSGKLGFEKCMDEILAYRNIRFDLEK
ncbi:cytidylate kinase [Aequitasia blattaphilus]|uniref:Cytidylate kinase-like family protein n=1 Tax=Aequitasia blattaphilus TaxID=2949332 RepID=A0ABT1EAQ7_9FIRM|nr:cytidylate kinase-like family protein [Aequitasia blattaphilus]MCP1101587.1 cytidylate kinase-like family protein [Aequitasia blattaphilus]MCR8614227.1 cytidylate kinase-like family protein [Aequitasia blattaphilus]